MHSESARLTVLYLFGYGALCVVTLGFADIGVDAFVATGNYVSLGRVNKSGQSRSFRMVVGDGDDFEGIDSIGDDGDSESGRNLANEFLEELRSRKDAQANVNLPKINEEKKEAIRKANQPSVKPSSASSSAGLFSTRNTVYSVPIPSSGGDGAAMVASAGNNMRRKRGLPRLQPFNGKKTAPKLGLQAMIAAALLSSGYWVQCLIGTGLVGAFFVLSWATNSISFDGGSSGNDPATAGGRSIDMVSTVVNGVPTLEK